MNEFTSLTFCNAYARSRGKHWASTMTIRSESRRPQDLFLYTPRKCICPRRRQSCAFAI